jgi:hypothetical protein
MSEDKEPQDPEARRLYWRRKLERQYSQQWAEEGAFVRGVQHVIMPLSGLERPEPYHFDWL